MRQIVKLGILFDRILDFLVVLAAVILVFILVSVASGVVMRYFIERPLSWVLAFSEYSLLYITFLVAARILKKDRHVRIDILLNHLKPKTRLFIEVVTSILSTAICLLFMYYGFQVTWEQFQMGRYEERFINIPFAYIAIIIPVGFLLLFVQFIRKSYNHIVNLKTSLRQ